MKRAILSGVIAALLLVALVSLPVLAQISNFDNIVVSNDFVVVDDANVGGLMRYTAATAVTVSNDSTVTPTGSYQPLTSAGNAGTATITVLSAGTVVHFVNTANTTITFTDTGTLKLSGNAALGQFDTLTVVSDGTNWVELSKTNN